MIFDHTYLEKGMWRGWLRNGQSLEISWPRSSIACRVLIHSNDMDQGDRMLNIGLGFVGLYIPLGISRQEYQVGEEPSWGIDLSREFGVILTWGHRRKQFDWPWDLHTLAYEQHLQDGAWVDVFERDADVYKEQHPYTYTLRSGEVQQRTATVSKRRHVLCRRAFKRLGWPRWIKESINVEFDDEVGERTGSWKGGTIGCGYDLRPGETMLDSLRRMERTRTF